MSGPDAHRKLVNLLCLLLLAAGLLVALAGCGGVLPAQQGHSGSPFQTYDQVVDSFEQIVPNMTQAQDLPNLGFDPHSGDVDVLSYVDVEARFLPAAGVRWEHLDPAVQACIQAQLYCNGYVFRPNRSDSQRIGALVPDLFGFRRVTLSSRWSAEITLLVMNGRVIHKVFSGHPPSQTLEDRRQPLGPLQDLGSALAHAAGTVNPY